MVENWRKKTAKRAWGDLSEEKTKYKTAVLYMAKVAHNALRSRAAYEEALDAIAKMAEQVIPKEDMERFGIR